MKKIDELKQALAKLKEEAKALNNEGKVDEAEAKLTEVRSLNKQIEIQIEIDKEEEKEIGVKMITENREMKNDEVEIRDAFFKALVGKPLTVEERALVYSGDANNSGLVVPKDFQSQINELKRQYTSAKQLLNVVTVSTESGSFVVENTGTMTGLVNYDEATGADLPETNPVFRNVEYDIDTYGAITPVSRSFLQDEAGNFMQYLIRHFARKATMTENAEIFAELALNKIATPVATLADVKRVVNVDLDPALKGISVVAMNQDAFQFLDEMEDGMGRPLLQPNPSQATDYLLLGLPVYVFSNAELPSTGDEIEGFTAPIFVGALQEGAIFFDRDVYEVGISEDAGFTKNQIIARVVERFDVKQADADSYVMASVAI